MEDKIDKIYEVIGVQYAGFNIDEVDLKNVAEENRTEDYKIYLGGHLEYSERLCMIGDVLDWMIRDKPPIETELMRKIMWEWKELRKPIESQSTECISFIYSLISDGQEEV